MDVMSEDEAHGYRQRLEQLETKYPAQLNAENRNNAHLSFMFMDEIAHHPVILDCMEDLMGGNFALWGTVLFIKEPQSQGFVSWHQDATYMGIEPHEFITPWLALTPSNRNNGCMSMIPGSHKDRIQPHDDTFHQHNILTRGQEIKQVDEGRAVDLILKPGQMSVHHARVVHGSKPNTSDQRRIGVVMQGYAASHCRQAIGENYWQPIRGEFNNDEYIKLARPKSDMDSAGVENRNRVNQNWSDILYRDARERRAY